jgi:hypothetical protein
VSHAPLFGAKKKEIGTMATRRRSTLAAATTVLVLAVMLTATSARATGDELRVVNQGKHVLSEIYATSTVAHLLYGDKSWGKNILGASLPPGAETTFSKGPKPSTAGACKQDMRLAYTDGYVKIATEINMCTTTTLQLRY